MKIFLKIFPLIAGGVLFVFILGCRQHIVKPAVIPVKSATIPPKDTAVVDIDGNVYSSVTIGTQTWLVENLKTTRYRNGDPIGNVTDGDLWRNLISDAYCDYNNDSSNAETYGRLYNWFAVDDDRGIAPAGWHVATNEEWITLSTYLAGGDYLKGSRESGDQLKESGTLHWANGNTGNNKSGFTALPGGERVYTNSKY